MNPPPATAGDRPLRIAVGVDGSPSSLTALAWAADLSVDDDEIHVVTGESPPENRPRLEAEWLATLPADRARLHVSEQPAAEALATVADETGADLVVVGTHQGLAGTPRVLGSVTHRLLRSSPCPVAVVPESTATPPTDGPVVAGVGDGPATRASIDWAAWLAAREARAVHLVRGVNIRPIFGVDHAMEVMASYIDTGLLRDWAEAEVDLVADELGSKGLDTTTTVAIGRAGKILVDAGGDARVIVVGKHLDGPITGYFTGVTLHHVLTHAPCPVVVVAAESTEP